MTIGISSTCASELAGLGTAIFWAFSAICWAFLGRRASPTSVSVVRLLLASIILMGIHAALFGSLWPTAIPPKAMAVLILSGLAGAALGDVFYFHSVSLLGPRLAMTISALAPVVAALLGLFPPLSEKMTLLEIVGMLVAVGGVVWVVSEKHGRQAWPTTPHSLRQGILLGLIGSFFQAVGFVCSRIGMNVFTANHVEPFSATVVRVTAACVGCWLILIFKGRVRLTLTPFFNRTCMAWMMAGVIAGPVIGIWLSMIALSGASTGIASTLVSMSPLALIPMSWAAYGERPTWTRVLATTLALGGIALMMIHGKT